MTKIPGFSKPSHIYIYNAEILLSGFSTIASYHVKLEGVYLFFIDPLMGSLSLIKPGSKEHFFERSEAESPGWDGLIITPDFNPGKKYDIRK